jgi:molecular chaperone DnaJ
MTPPKDYHEILGISPGADPQQIKRAFKELAFQFHPDRNPHNPSAEEKFKEVAEAYAYLSGNRELFEAMREAPARSKKARQVFADIYDEIFGIDMDQWTPPGKDIYQGVDLSLEEAFFGVTKKFTIWREVLCGECEGSGAPPGVKSPTCTFCFGRGAITVNYKTVKADKPCPKCHGVGRIPQESCHVCRGKGVVPVKERVSVSIPPRVFSGQEVRIPGLGSLAARSLNPGNLVLQIFLKLHERFTFDGPHILCEVPVDFWMAEQGGPLKVPTVGGEAMVELPAGVQTGTVFRLAGLGLGGDEIIRIRVLKPSESSATSAPFLEGSPSPKSRALSVRRGGSFWSKIKKILFG